MDWQVYSMNGSGNAAMGPEIFFLVAIIVILLQLRTRRVRLWSLVIMPVFLGLVTAVTIAVDYNGPGTLLLSTAGFGFGCVAGAIIGSRMVVTVDEDGRIMLKGSMIAVFIWILVLGLKIFGKGIIGDLGLISLNDLTAALLAMTLGTLIARRAYVLLKYLQLKKQGTTTTKNVIEPLKPV